MQCEACGKLMREGKRIKLEGSIVVVCAECAPYGTVIGDTVKPPEKKVVKKEPEKPAVVPVMQELDAEVLVEDYGQRIRKAREKKGLKQEDFAKSINEPVSVIHRLESGRFDGPSTLLVKKLESHLGVKLYEKQSLLGALGLKKGASKDLTLGDVVVVKKKQVQ